MNERHVQLLLYEINNIITRNKVKNMENHVKKQDFLDFLRYQRLLTERHRCRPSYFNFLRYQCVIEEVQQTLNVECMHVSLRMAWHLHQMIVYHLGANIQEMIEIMEPYKCCSLDEMDLYGMDVFIHSTSISDL